LTQGLSGIGKACAIAAKEVAAMLKADLKSYTINKAMKE
jgi:hypothetical protein